MQSYLPFGFIEDGLEQETIIDKDGQRWSVERTNRMLEESGHHLFGL